MSRQRSAPARQPSLREHNLALVLGEVADGGAISRARIAAATGLTKATVSTLVDALTAAGLLRELGPGAAAGVGRPGSSLALATGPVGIGLEINVDYLATCTVGLAGTVRRRELVAEDFRGTGTETTLARAAAALRAAVDDARADGGQVAGVTVAVPGLVEASRRLVRLAPNLGWRDVAVLDELSTRVGRTALDGVRLTLANEANLAALGELWCGEHRRPDGSRIDSFLHISGEVGVGAAIVIDGRLFGGVRGLSGEIGHLPLAADGPVCGCGSRGCLEQYAGQEAILRRAGLDRPARTRTGRPNGPVEELLERARAGDAGVLAAIREAAAALGTGISAMVNLVDVDTVLLGGLYAPLAPWMIEPVQEQLRLRVLASGWDPVRVLVARLGADGAVRGAATAVVRSLIDDPAAWIADGARRSGGAADRPRRVIR
jgi:predicted NBD/HSP70 family sugar kinase